MFKWKVEYTYNGKKKSICFDYDRKSFFESFLALLDKEIEKGNCGGYEFRRIRNYNKHKQL